MPKHRTQNAEIMRSQCSHIQLYWLLWLCQLCVLVQLEWNRRLHVYCEFEVAYELLDVVQSDSVHVQKNRN